MTKTTKPQKKKSAKNTKRKPRKLAATISLVTLIAGGEVAAGVALNGTSNDIITTERKDFTPKYTVSQNDLDDAKKSLAQLVVRSGTTNIPKYASENISGWVNIDDDKCDARFDILKQHLNPGKFDKKNCEILEGKLFDYYSGQELAYDTDVNGGGIDIDHVVAKGNAWISGGYVWDAEVWKNYANDPELLLPVSASLNRSKADKDASEWLPPNDKYHCRYVLTQVEVKAKYDLSVTKSEKAKMAEVLENNCTLK